MCNVFQTTVLKAHIINRVIKPTSILAEKKDVAGVKMRFKLNRLKVNHSDIVQVDLNPLCFINTINYATL